MKTFITVGCLLLAACSASIEPEPSPYMAESKITGEWVECDASGYHQTLVFSESPTCIVRTAHGDQPTSIRNDGDTSYVLSWTISNSYGTQEWSMALRLIGNSLVGSESEAYYYSGGTRSAVWPVAFSR